MDLMYFLELAVNGGLAGLMYALVAMSIVLIYKSSSVPNLAQGALVMVGAYVVLAIVALLKVPLWVAIPLAMVAMFFLGVGIERVALRRLAGRPVVMILMMTLGIDIFLRATTLTIWGGSGRNMPLGIPDTPLFIGPLLVNRAYAIGAAVTLVLFVVFMLLQPIFGAGLAGRVRVIEQLRVGGRAVHHEFVLDRPVTSDRATHAEHRGACRDRPLLA